MSFDQGRSRDVEAERGSGHRRARRERCAHPLACGGKRRDPTGTIDHDGPFRPGTGSLMLFTASPQGYSSLGSEPAGPRSGESRARTGAASRGSEYEQRAVGLGPPTRPAQATGGREDSRTTAVRRLARGSSPTYSSRVICPGLSPHPSTTPLTFPGSGTGTSIGSSNASAPIARMPSLQNSMHRLPGWSTSAGIVSTCLIFGTRVSGTVSINPFRSPRH